MTIFREHITISGSLVFGGKNAKNNEELIAQVKPNEEVFHTLEIGSPFVNIKEKPKKGSIKEAAIFCAAHSKAWKKNCDDVMIHRFKGKDVYKTKEMKIGTFGVKKLVKMKIKKMEIVKFLKGIEECRV